MSPENSKPEWFQMAEADAFEPKPKSKRVVRVMVLATPLLVLGVGLVFAQTQDSPTAVASSTTSAVSTPAATGPISLSSTPVATTPTAASTPASHTIQVSQATTTTPKASITIKKPGIKMPTGGGEDNALRSSDDD